MKSHIINTTCIALQSLLTLSQTDEVFRIISLVLTIISALIVLIRNILDWYNKAKQDGKIDKDEIKEVIDIVDDGVQGIQDKINKDK